MKLAEQNIRLHGRIPFDANGNAALWWSFAGCSFRFYGTGFSLSATFTDEQPAHLAFIIDGITYKRAINGEETFVSTVKDGEHTVFVRRVSNRAASGALLLTDFSVDGTLLTPPAKKQMNIEFVGDSITCGYGILGLPGGVYVSAEEDATINYAALLAAHFDAEARFISMSGRGIVHNCDGSCSNLIPHLFNRYGRGINTAPFLFDDGFIPDVVIVNAGTNDVGGKTTEQQMETAATLFLKDIRTRYPHAKIVWTYGMMNTKFIPALQKAVDTVRESDKNVWFMPTTPVQAHTGETGPQGHPGIVGHRRLAKELIAFLKEIL
ncbi:MAG: hypothetical protein J6L00_01590 [Clostridia bacterium]|nr:hypothetical protein [Clostridia bacterium]